MIYIVGIVSGTAGAAGNIVLNFPVSWGLAQNDVVYVMVASSSTADQNVTATGVGTWAELADLYANDTTDVNMGVYRQVMGASPDSSVTLDGTSGSANHAAIAVALRGVDTTTPEDAASTTAQTIDTGTPDNPAITTVTDHAWVLAFAGSSEPDIATAAPAGYQDLRAEAVSNIAAVFSRKKVDAAGVENPGSYGSIVGTGADSYCAVTVAVRPAAGGPTNIPEKMIQYTRRRAA
jgi:hypothetical protein